MGTKSPKGCYPMETRCSRRQQNSPASGAATWCNGWNICIVFDSICYIMWKQHNHKTYQENQNYTRWKILRESTNPRESVFVTNTWQHLPHLLFCGSLVPNFLTQLFCKPSLVIVYNCRFTEFFDCYFHIPLPIVTKHKLGLSFPPRNLRIKFGANTTTIILVVVFTDRQTHTQTNAGENIFPRFCGDNNTSTEPRPQVTCTENLEFGFKACEQTDTHADRCTSRHYRGWSGYITMMYSERKLNNILST